MADTTASHYGRPRVPGPLRFLILWIVGGLLVWHLAEAWRGGQYRVDTSMALLRQVEAAGLAEPGPDRATDRHDAHAVDAPGKGINDTGPGDDDQASAQASATDGRLVADMPAEQIPAAAQAPNGLFFEVYDPALAQQLDRPSAAFHCPNGVASLATSARIAARIADRRPRQAQRTLRFAVRRLPDLRDLYRVQTGEPASDQPSSANTDAAVLELAVALDDRFAHTQLLPRIHRHLRRLVAVGSEATEAQRTELAAARAALRASIDWRQSQHHTVLPPTGAGIGPSLVPAHEAKPVHPTATPDHAIY